MFSGTPRAARSPFRRTAGRTARSSAGRGAAAAPDRSPRGPVRRRPRATAPGARRPREVHQPRAQRDPGGERDHAVGLPAGPALAAAPGGRRHRGGPGRSRRRSLGVRAGRAVRADGAVGAVRTGLAEQRGQPFGRALAQRGAGPQDPRGGGGRTGGGLGGDVGQIEAEAVVEQHGAARGGRQPQQRGVRLGTDTATAGVGPAARAAPGDPALPGRERVLVGRRPYPSHRVRVDGDGRPLLPGEVEGVPHGAAGERGVAGEQLDLAGDGAGAVRVESVVGSLRCYA